MRFLMVSFQAFFKLSKAFGYILEMFANGFTAYSVPIAEKVREYVEEIVKADEG
jgi:hypothetical protein